MLVLQPISSWSIANSIITLLWSAHFIRRLIESNLVHKHRATVDNKPVLEEIAGAVVYYGGFGAFIAWSIGSQQASKSPSDPTFILSAMIFIVGEVGNWLHHRQLSSLPRPRDGSYALPKGLMFKYLACPHYFFEVVSWFGFSTLCGTWASILFLLASYNTMSKLADEKFRTYQRLFDGRDGEPLYLVKYRIIPFIY